MAAAAVAISRVIVIARVIGASRATALAPRVFDRRARARPANVHCAAVCRRLVVLAVLGLAWPVPASLRPSRAVQLSRPAADGRRRRRHADRPRPRRRLRAEALRRRRTARPDGGAAARAGAGRDPGPAAAPAARRTRRRGHASRRRSRCPIGRACVSPCDLERAAALARPHRPRHHALPLRPDPPDLRQRLRRRGAPSPGHSRRQPRHLHLLRRLVAGRRRGARHLRAGRRRITSPSAPTTCCSCSACCCSGGTLARLASSSPRSPSATP